MKIIAVTFALLIFSTMAGQPADQNNEWEYVKLLVGKWIGESENIAGSKISNSLFTSELDDNIIIRKNYSDYLFENNQVGFRQEDLLIIFRYNDGTINATYFDNDHHVINFNIEISESENKITLLSEPFEGLTLYRIIYTIVDKKNISMRYEIAESGKLKDFVIQQDYNLVKNN